MMPPPKKINQSIGSSRLSQTVAAILHSDSTSTHKVFRHPWLPILFSASLAANPLQAATITVADGAVNIAADGTCSLREAIVNANTDTLTHGDCLVAGAGADTLVLPTNGTFSIMDIDNVTDGNNGLPTIVSDITIDADNATITRDAGAIGDFRIFHVNTAAGNLTVNDGTISNGLATIAIGTQDEGGAIFVRQGTLTLNDSVVTGSSAVGRGGGIYNTNGGAVNLNDTTVSNNSSNTGGGIYNRTGSITLDRSTISGNSTIGRASAFDNEGAMTLINSTVSSNIGGGIAIFLRGSGGTTFINSTIFGNTGTGLRVEQASTVATLQNTIIAGNSGPECLRAGGAPVPITNSFSIIEDGTCSTSAMAVDPRLDILQSNGGATQTHALMLDSPAIDAGDNTVCANAMTVNDADQRGQPRNPALMCDIGAFEVQPSLRLVPSPASFSENGGTSTVTVSRVGTANSGVLTVNLMSGDIGEVTVPTSVNIPDMSASTTFVATGADETQDDGDQMVTLTATAGGFATGNEVVTITDDDVATLTLSTALSSIAENGTTTATVLRNSEPPSGPLTVTLLSSDTITGATVPVSVTIPDMLTSVNFTVTGVNEALDDGDQNITLTASSTGFMNGTSMLTVTDNDPFALTLTADLAAFAENSGATGTVTRNSSPATGNLTVTLSSDDTMTGATVPATVVIPNTMSSVTFPITGVIDNLDDGDQNVTLTATDSTMTATDNIMVMVTDIDAPGLTLNVSPPSIPEGGTATVTITRNTSPIPTTPLTVTLSSSDVAEVAVPASIDIPASQNSVNFSVTGADDLVIDLDQTVTLSASATGFSTVMTGLTVTNNDTSSLLTASVNGEGTLIGPGINCPGDCSETLAPAFVNFLATPADGWVFSSWGDDCSGSTSTTTAGFVQMGISACSVTFEPLPPTASVTLNGTAIANGSTIDFGQSPPDEPNSQTLIVTNAGTETLILTSPVAPAGFSISNLGTTMLERNQSAAITISLLTGGAPGVFGGTAQFSTNDSGTPVFSIPVTGEVLPMPNIAVNGGSIVSGMPGFVSLPQVVPTESIGVTFSISNTGNIPLNLSGVGVSAEFTLNAPATTQLQPDGQTSFEIVFSPTEEGEVDGIVTIASDDPDENPFTFPIRGTAAYIGEPSIVLPAGTGAFDLGSAEQGQVIDISGAFSIVNAGSNILQISSVDVPAGFAVDLSGLGNSLLVPSSNASFTVSLTNTEAGRYGGDVSVFSNDPVQPVLSFSISATITDPTPSEPSISVIGGGFSPGSTDPVDFGTLLIGMSRSIVFDVRNNGQNPLLLNSINTPPGFSSPGLSASLLEQGESTLIEVILSSMSAGDFGGAVEIFSNDPNVNPFTIPVTGQVRELFPITINVVGQGRVVSTPPGIDCPGACTASYDLNTALTLRTTTSEGFFFYEWEGDCAQFNAPDIVVTINTEIQCDAIIVDELLPEPVDILRMLTVADLATLTTVEVDRAPGELLSRFLTNVESTLIAPDDVMNILPPGWAVDANTGGLTVPDGTLLTFRALSPIDNQPDNLNVPPERPDLGSGFGLGGRSERTLLELIQEALVLAGFNNLQITQNSSGVLVATDNNPEAANITYNFISDVNRLEQVDLATNPVGLAFLPGFQIAIVVTTGQKIPLIPISNDLVELAQLVAATIRVGTSGDIIFSFPNGERLVVLFDLVSSPDSNGLPLGLNLLPPTQRTTSNPSLGLVVFSGGRTQQIYPYFPEPETFRLTALAVSPLVTSVTLNLLNGTANTVFDNFNLVLTPQSTTLVRTLATGETQAPSITVNADLTLTYVVQSGDEVLSTRVLISF